MSQNGDPTNTCLLCTKRVTTDGENYLCIGCGKKFHQSCVPHSSSLDKNNWKCELCRGKSQEKKSDEPPMNEERETKNACLICTKETATTDKECAGCHKKFHRTCVPKSTLLDGDWKCKMCFPRKAPSEKAASKTSKRSCRSEIQIQRLEEEKKMQEESLAKELEIEERKLALERMKLVRQRAIDQEFIKKKYAIIEDDNSSRGSVASGKSQANEDEEAMKKQHEINNWINQQPQSQRAHYQQDVPLTLNPEAVPFAPPFPAATGHMCMNDPVKLTREQLASRSLLGKLPFFSGDVREWPSFISQYNRSTMLCGFSDEENVGRLQKCLTDKALALVKPMLSMPGSAGEIIYTLQQRYGKPEAILQELLDDINTTKVLKLEDPTSLIDLSVKVNTICLTIQQGGLSDHLSNPCLVKNIVKKLPSILQIFWSGYKATLPNESCLLIAFNKWLKTYFNIACDMEASSSQKSTESKNKGFLNVHFTNEKKTNRNEFVKPCLACGERCSTLDQCAVFKKCSIDERWKCVKDKKLCFGCLKPHIYWFCKERNVCPINNCGKKHHTLLHEEPKEEPSINAAADLNVHQSGVHTLFRILPVRIYNKEKFVEILAFIDEGSSTTLIESDVLSMISAEGVSSPLCLKWTGEICRTEHESKKVNGLEISAINSSERFGLQMVRSVSKLDLPAQELCVEEIQKYEHTMNLPISPYTKSKPRLLLGLNNAYVCSTLGLAEGKLLEPIAAKTKIGWTLYGPSSTGNSESVNVHICDGDLHNLVKESFNLDSIGIVRTEKCLIPFSERKALDMLNQFTKRSGDRFESGLLWRFPNASLPDSFKMAKQRLNCLEKRFQKNPDLKALMQKQMDDYKSKGYVKKLSSSELNKPVEKVWYLPIFPVINPNKPGKVRMVWDAAAQVDGVSLNSLLLKGPDQLSSLIGVLFRFREYEIAVCGDIEQMFHRILMKASDQDCQRFLWREEGCVNVYKMTVLTFGASCSPSTAQFVKNKNAAEYSHYHPEAAEAIRRNHYVDDYLDSFRSLELASKISKEVSFIHSKGGFNIRNWLSNSQEAINGLECSSSGSTKNISILTEGADKVLGMWWCTNNDSFTYSLRLEGYPQGEKPPTKREILRTLMRVFDPLGLISHVLVFAKVLLKRSGAQV